MKDYARELVPPIVFRGLRYARDRLVTLRPVARDASQQNLDIYWDPKMAEMLDRWGEGNAWNDIQLLMAGRHGRVLDIACGTGRTMEMLAGNPDIEVHGCDISDLLIDKAIARGISRDRLDIVDATAMNYPDQSFDWAYSIGSLEHFTADGIREVSERMPPCRPSWQLPHDSCFPQRPGRRLDYDLPELSQQQHGLVGDEVPDLL